MSRKLLALSSVATLMGGTALSDVPGVVVDIAPVHSLVAQVMDGLGAPNLIIPAGASPHEYNLRPSEAEALQNANVVFWIGQDLTPWLQDSIDTLAEDARIIALLESEGTRKLEFREGALFEAHDHDDHEDHDGHDDEHDHDHEAQVEEHDNDPEDQAEAGHDGHDHGAYDPHAWLSIENARVWLNTIAAALSAADPENAGAYYANAAAGRKALMALSDEIEAVLGPVRGQNFIVFHDAYQYFESDFDFPASGAISLGDASDPSPARIVEIQGRVADQGIHCVVSEPQYNPNIVATVMGESDANTGVLDPLGAGLEPGKALYPQLLRNLANTLAGCL